MKVVIMKSEMQQTLVLIKPDALKNSLTGYILSGIVALAAFIAICGFCVGCFLFFQYNMKKHKLFGSKTAPQFNTAS